VRVDFSIAEWAAWAPGLTSREAWEAWARAPMSPRGAETPPLAEVPAMSRRRVERLGRLAYQVAQWAQGEARGVPMVFTSRHGDTARSVDLLSALARGEALSPTSFGLSVHNAIAAQYSITRKDPVNVTALSNGRFSVEAAVLEAVALLGEGHDEVLLVDYDAAYPPLFAPFADEPEADFAWAWRVRRGAAFSLESTAPGLVTAQALPQGLAVLRFFLSGEAAFEAADALAGWRWRRYA
jgi:hypothetical protein